MSWSRFFRRKYWDEERSREIEAYIEWETAENMARGMAAEEARYAAIRKFGNPSLVREEIYRMNSIGFLETLWQNLRYGIRGLRSSPVFTVVAILSLALGIGANTAIFQLFDAVRLRLLPVKDPGQLVDVKLKSLRNRGPSDKVGRHSDLTNAVWEQIRAHQQVFSGVAAWGNSSFNLAPRGEARNMEGLYVSGDFFHVLGVQPVLGRVFSVSDDQRGCGSPGAVISYGFWQREFSANAGVIGRKLTLNGHPLEIIGITPASFFGVDVGHEFDVAVPICSEPLLEPAENAVSKRTYWWLGAIGRLRPGVSAQLASAQLQVISPGIFQATVPPVYSAEYVKGYLDLKLEAAPAGSGVSSIRAEVESPLILLLSIAGLVLLIACANLANLMLALASTREREIAVRLALGASRQRLVFQLLSESLLLAFTGAALGIMLAQVLSRFLVLFISSSTNPIFLNISPDWRVLGFTTALAVLTCLLFGLTPALRATHIEPSAAMKAGGRGSSASRQRFGLRRFLVISQVALSLVLVAGALLFVRSLSSLLTVGAGFQQNGVLVANLDMSKLGFTADRQRVANEEILERLRHVPGVASAAMFFIEPTSGGGWNERVTLEGKENQKNWIYFDRVSAGYFRTLSIPRVAGRDFTENDTPTSPKVAIVNEAFARKYAGGANPIGMRFQIERHSPGEPEPFYQIVGLVKDTKYRSLREAFVPLVYEAESQRADPDNEPSFFVRSSLSSLHLISSVTKAISGVEPSATMSFSSFKTDIRERLLPERLMATLSSFFGFLAVVLATVGLYGVMAYMVARRRNEIGIRMALGADQVRVVSMVLREAATLLAVGLLVGILLTLFAARAASSLLFGIPSWDPVSLGIAAGSLAVIGLLASCFPALRAARLDPMKALREE